MLSPTENEETNSTTTTFIKTKFWKQGMNDILANDANIALLRFRASAFECWMCWFSGFVLVFLVQYCVLNGSFAVWARRWPANNWHLIVRRSQNICSNNTGGIRGCTFFNSVRMDFVPSVSVLVASLVVPAVRPPSLPPRPELACNNKSV